MRVVFLETPVVSYDAMLAGVYEIDLEEGEILENGEVTHVQRLLRVRVAFGSMLRTLSHCRPVVAADATFLTGCVPGTLYCVVGKDANNHLVPAAFMLTFAEEGGRDWLTFLRMAQSKMPHVRICMADAHKGLIRAIEAVGWKHSRCAVHLYRNMKSNACCQRVLQSQVTNLAKVTSHSVFDFLLGKIRVISTTSADFLARRKDEYCAASFLPDYPRFGEVTSNMAEQFNAELVRYTNGIGVLKAVGWLSVVNGLLWKLSNAHKERCVTPSRRCGWVDDHLRVRLLILFSLGADAWPRPTAKVALARRRRLG